MGEIIEFIVEGIIDCFGKLADFEFLGTNMLKFSVTIMLIGILIPIIFTIPLGHNVEGTLRSQENKPRSKSMRERAREFNVGNKRRSDRYK